MKNIICSISILSLLLIFRCTSKPVGESKDQILHFYCNAESVSGNDFINGPHKFNNGKTQSSEKAFSGKHSCLLDKTKVYGFSKAISDLKSGDTIKVSCMRFSDFGFGVLAISDGEEVYTEIRQSVKVNGWDSLHTVFVIPSSYNNKQIKVYPYYKFGEKVFFDDLRIEIVKSKPKLGKPYLIEHMNIEVNDSTLAFLKNKRLDALNKGSLKKDGKVYVSAKLSFNEKTIKVKARLKGDLLDHIESDKWSFRINLNKKNRIFDMKRFSVHNAKSRDFLNEWVFHRLLDDENIINTYYEFIEFSINGSPKGIYALESTFDNSVFERQKLAPKPILRINEDGIWNSSSRGLSKHGSLAYISAEVKGFLSQKSDDFPSFLKAQKLLEKYKQGSLNVKQVFDIDHLAKYVAIVDLCKAHHALRWQNIRCYLDEESKKLRLIGFDGYGPEGPMGIKKPFLGFHVSGKCDPYSKGEDCFLGGFYESAEFVAKYNFYLNKFTKQAYIDDLLESLSTDISEIENQIKASYPDYTYSYNFLSDNAKEILKYLIPMKEVTIKAYRTKGGIKVMNYGPTFIDLLADKNGWSDNIILKSYINGKPADTLLVPKIKGNRIYYNVLGIDSTYSEKILSN